MNKIFTLLLATVITTAAFAQNKNTFKEDLDPFSKLIVDPYINVELVKGEDEKIEVFYDNVDPGEIFVEQRGRLLYVYLAEAKIGLSLFRGTYFTKKKYRNANVKMIITYKALKNIQFRGEEELTCNDELTGNRIKLKAFGETTIRIASIDARKFKVALFGENDFKVGAGTTMNNTINTYGENTVDATKLISHGVKTHSFGENKVSLNATEYLSVMHFGDGEIRYSGRPHVDRKWVIGEVDVRRAR